MKYYFPFGEELKPLKQQDRTPKKVFVLGVYASAVHARWKCGSTIVCQALAVASEPRIFWDGNPDEAAEIIGKIKIPKELGTLETAGSHLNGPSAKVLDEHILAPLGFTRKDAWLCDLLPETRLNPSQVKALKEKYEPKMKDFGLNEVTIPKRPNVFSDRKRCEEIVAEIEESKADMLVLLGDIPIKQFLNVVAEVDYNSLLEYKNQYGYGISTEAVINGKSYKILPLAHPRQIGALGGHSENWFKEHKKWEDKGSWGRFY
jgi:hypothetical protein